MISKEAIVERIQAIPPLPANIQTLLSVLNSSKSTIKEIVAAVECDLSLSAALLKTCNSAHFGIPRSVGSIRDAIQFLGTEMVLELLMSLRAGSMLKEPQAGYGLELGALWRHSLAVGIASRAFGVKLGVEDCDLLFTAGLFHDIGKIILSENVSNEYAQILRMVDEEKMDFTEAEEKVLGYSHSEVGAMLAETWSLPETIVRCIRFHHAPGSLDEPDAMVDAVYLANTLCMLLGIGLGSDGLRHRADEEVMERNGLTELDLELFGAETLLQFRKIEQSFSFGSDSGVTPVAAHHTG